MSDQNSQNNTPDNIYDLGFDKSLNRDLTSTPSTTVYNSITDAIQGQSIQLGALVAGSNNTMVVIDPSKGFWLGNQKYDSAPFKVNMEGEMKATTGNIGSWALDATSLSGSGSSVITGGTLQTNTAGHARLVMTGSSIRGYNGGDVNRLTLSNDTLELNDAGGVPGITLRDTKAQFLNCGLQDIGGAVYPGVADTHNLGLNSLYWHEVNTHDLTKRGGGTFGSFDHGVELQDGKKVSDIDAILQWTEHPTRKTKYGVPALDYRKAPKDVFVPSDFPRNIDDIPFDTDKDGKIILRPDSDGEAVFPTISIMLGAIKELAGRVETLENEIKLLKK